MIKSDLFSKQHINFGFAKIMIMMCYVGFFRLFGIPLVLDESPSQQVIDFIFDKYTTKPVQNEQTATNDAEHAGIDDVAIKTYLNFVSNISTEFDGEALALLKYYFIVTRSIRPSMRYFFFLIFLLKC